MMSVQFGVDTWAGVCLRDSNETKILYSEIE